jgi:hypothetical protein
MSNLTPEFVSNFIVNQFPERFQDTQPELVAFILAYYEWLETTGKSTQVLRQLRSNRDIDDTVSDFIIHFKKTYLEGTQLQTTVDDRFLLKHISDLYQAKGSSRSVELLLQILYGQEVEVFLPSSRLLKPSESNYYKPVYLELSPSPRNKTLIGKGVTGSSTGSTGFIESVITKTINGKRVSLAYLSSVVGTFKTGEFVTDDGIIDDAPQVIGSLSDVIITNGGRNFAVGDRFSVVSNTGQDAVAKITSVVDASGRVSYDLANGGYGYAVSNTYTRTLSSNATIEVINVANANADITDFFTFEDVEQRMATITWNAGTQDFEPGDHVQGTNTTAVMANGHVLTITGNTAQVQIANGTFTGVGFLKNVSNATTNAAVSLVVNSTAKGEVIGRSIRGEDSNTFVYGVNANNKPFVNHSSGKLVGLLSNTTASIANVGAGVGGDFEVGVLGVQEQLTLFTDIIGANNTAEDPRPYTDLYVGGSNSGIGFVDSVTIDTGMYTNSRANSGTPFAANGGFSNGQYIFEANLVVNSVFVTQNGALYSNSDTVVFAAAGAATNAAATIQTDGDGRVMGVVMANNGIDYQRIPAITITTSTGSGANLIANMHASGNSIGAVGVIKSTTNATHFVIRNLSNGAFTDGRTITNLGTNAFANIVNTSILAGTGYVNADTVTITGGSPNVTATGIFAANSGNVGSAHSITVNEPGSEYLANGTISISTSTGSGASLSVNMDYGYGLPKSGHADTTTILYNALTFANFTIGEIGSLNFINPGSGYNYDPVAVAHNPYVAGFNRRDLICVVNNENGSFIANENLSQTLSLPGFLVVHSNSSVNGITLASNSAPLTVGEGVIQITTGATGDIAIANATHIKITNPVGTFSGTNKIQTQASGANVAPLSGAATSAVTTQAVATGTYKTRTTENGINQIKIRRLSFGQAFVPGATLTGATSGATANVTHAYQDDETAPIGLNASITANVITANGVADGVEILNAGYGYEANTPLSLTAANTVFIVSGRSRVEKQGLGEGTWTDRTSFPSDINKIQDSDYYQEYSYVTRTGIALAKYEEQLKDILHVAGTRLFGEVVKTQIFSTTKIKSDGVTVTTS